MGTRGIFLDQADTKIPTRHLVPLPPLLAHQRKRNHFGYYIQCKLIKGKSVLVRGPNKTFPASFSIEAKIRTTRTVIMWSVAGQHKRYNDALSSYNSLRDPHLNSYFRRPQMRRHLLKANIINQDNRIVDEISSTKHLQTIERKRRKDLYRLLEGYIKKNEFDNLDMNWEESAILQHGSPQSLQVEEKLIKHANVMLSGSNKKNVTDYLSPLKDSVESVNGVQSSILQRLDRMIRAIKKHEHLIAYERASTSSRFKPSVAKMYSSQSWQDLSNREQHLVKADDKLKLYSSSRELRPKSSYGRQKHDLNATSPNSENGFDDLNLQKSKSVTCLVAAENRAANDDDDVKRDIESLEGNSMSDNDRPYFRHNGSPLIPRMHVTKKSSNNEKFVDRDAYCEKTFTKKFDKNYSCKQKAKMTLRYNGLTSVAKRGAKRSVKVFQQVTNGGNSILIYDGFVNTGGTFTFDIRPHPTNSFAIIILVNGIRDLRLNTCCEHKHRPGTKLSNFTFVDVVGVRPCFACQNIVSFASFEREIDITKKNFDWFMNKSYELHANLPAVIGNNLTRSSTPQCVSTISDDTCRLFDSERRSSSIESHPDSSNLDENYGVEVKNKNEKIKVKKELNVKKEIEKEKKDEIDATIIEDKKSLDNKNCSPLRNFENNILILETHESTENENESATIGELYKSDHVETTSSFDDKSLPNTEIVEFLDKPKTITITTTMRSFENYEELEDEMRSIDYNGFLNEETIPNIANIDTSDSDEV